MSLDQLIKKEILDNIKNIKIQAKSIKIGKKVSFGRNIDIEINGHLEIGDYSYIGDNSSIRGNNISIGKHFYGSGNLKIGGGGSNNRNSNLEIGDRCVMHNNYINLAMPVSIGNDVGLSPDVQILTHGFWGSVLEGYPAKFDPVSIGDNVIIGQRSIILPGITIQSNIVIGAHTTVSKSLLIQNAIYAGNPVKMIRDIRKPSLEEKKEILNHIIKDKYCKEYNPNGAKHLSIDVIYPCITFKYGIINAETGEYSMIENKYTDDLRDFLRRYGIRIYTERPFKSLSYTDRYNNINND